MTENVTGKSCTSMSGVQDLAGLLRNKKISSQIHGLKPIEGKNIRLRDTPPTSGILRIVYPISPITLGYRETSVVLIWSPGAKASSHF